MIKFLYVFKRLPKVISLSVAGLLILNFSYYEKTFAGKTGSCSLNNIDSIKGLKDYYKDFFPVGVSVSPNSLTGAQSVLILKHFQSLTAENVMKPALIHPEENRYYWDNADKIVNFAVANGMLMRGHTLCWHKQTPGWMFKDPVGNTVSKEVLLSRLKDHITKVVTRYKNKVYAWDVVNEAIDDDDSKYLRDTEWYKICGEEYIAKAFQWAHEADPNALLFYNDYNTESPAKRDKVYRMLKNLLDKGVPIHGIGLQGHWNIYDPSEKNLRDAIEKFSSLGLKIQITELDVSVYSSDESDPSDKIFTAERELKQIEKYKMVFRVFRDYKSVITGVTFWNVSDKTSWLDNFPVKGRKNYPLLFDQNLKPKKAYWEVIKFLNAKSINESFISTENGKGKLAITASGKSTPLLISSNDWPGVIRAFKDLQSDIGKTASIVPELYTDNVPDAKEIIIAGTIGKSAIIDKLVQDKKIDISLIKGQWETFLIQIINTPLPGVRKALIIAGSDKRGTIYGIYEISKQIGVSPWYWWADVPVLKKNAIYVNTGRYTQGSPSVRYRGIFLNDEAPDLTNWIREKFGYVTLTANPPVPNGVANYGHEFYTRLFELLLRLKGNYLWPAMWNNAFNEDDPENPKLADEYGIVMGNSHQEPMLRAQKEWDRRYLRSIGTWNWAKNPDILESFWRDGIKRNKNYESIVTIGLRGANDTEMSPGGPQANMAMLEKIVDVQRKILTDEINTDITKIPQLWCLYKEVQDYYNAGMRVPDDVTLLWAEDNWGNIRRLPTVEERKRSGGAGIYYHFDYHGGPRSYQWLNTSPIAKIWDQMSLAKQYGADRIWIVNVGHFKGYELPMEYFLDLAWNTEGQTNENINEYTEQWASRQFGQTYSSEIAGILSGYTKYNGRRKPELLSPSTYSLINYNEAEKVVEEYKTLAAKADEIFNKLPEEMHDAFYQLVLFPTKASAMVNELYLAAGKNNLYARQGRASTTDMANQTRLLFRNDTSLMGYFNRLFAGGKWKHFMDQSHLGYTTWADPPLNSLRAINLKESNVPDAPSMGISVEGSEAVWPGDLSDPVLPQFDIFSRQSHCIDVFNRGKGTFNFNVTTDNTWIIINKTKGAFGFDDRIWVTVDWTKIPKGKSRGTVKISGTGNEVTVLINAFNPVEITTESLRGFVEGEGYVSIEAEHFTRSIEAGTSRWIRIDNYGHTLSAMRANAEVDAASAVPGTNSPCLEYQMFLFSTGSFDISSIFSPTLNFMAGRALQYAISFDNETPQIITLVPEDYNARNGNSDWEKSVCDNVRISHSTHNINSTGYHTLKLFMIDPGVVLQKIIVNSGGLKPSYLGPPESYFNPTNSK